MSNYRHEPPKQDFSEGISNLVRAWQEAAKVSADIAHAKRAIYEAYIAEGFTDAQALDLIKSL